MKRTRPANDRSHYRSLGVLAAQVAGCHGRNVASYRRGSFPRSSQRNALVLTGLRP